MLTVYLLTVESMVSQDEMHIQQAIHELGDA
jgi:hypothetical protein